MTDGHVRVLDTVISGGQTESYQSNGHSHIRVMVTDGHVRVLRHSHIRGTDRDISGDTVISGQQTQSYQGDRVISG